MCVVLQRWVTIYVLYNKRNTHLPPQIPICTLTKRTINIVGYCLFYRLLDNFTVSQLHCNKLMPLLYFDKRKNLRPQKLNYKDPEVCVLKRLLIVKHLQYHLQWKPDTILTSSSKEQVAKGKEHKDNTSQCHFYLKEQVRNAREGQHYHESK